MTKKKATCDLHTDPNTRPNAAPIGKRVMSFLSFNDEQKLVTKYLLDSNGKFRLRHPVVIAALWKLVSADVIAELQKYDAECGDESCETDE